MSLVTKLTVDLLATLTKSLDVIGNMGIPINAGRPVVSLATGTGDDQADLVYHDRKTGLASAASQNYDLSASLTDVFGDAVVMVNVKMIVIINRSAVQGTPTEAVLGVDGNLIVSICGASTDIPVGPGGLFVWASPLDGEAVTNDTADTITITNDDGADAAEFDIFIIGTSA